jgi:hypothetical protein
MFLWCDTDRIENDASNNSTVGSVLVAVVTCLLSRCLATIGDTHTDRLMGGVYEVRHWDGLRCHDIHTKFFLWRLVQSFISKGHAQTHRKEGDRISLLWESRLEKVSYVEYKIKSSLIRGTLSHAEGIRRLKVCRNAALGQVSKLPCT